MLTWLVKINNKINYFDEKFVEKKYFELSFLSSCLTPYFVQTITIPYVKIYTG